MAIHQVADRRRQHVGQPHRAVVAQHQHVGVERTGHGSRQQAGAGNEIEAEALEVCDGGLGRHHALAAHDLGLALLDRMEDQRRVAAGAAEMRLDHLQGEGRRHGGVERIAAALENSHADRGRDPVGGSHDAERAGDLRARREGVRIDQLQGLPPGRAISGGDLRPRSGCSPAGPQQSVPHPPPPPSLPPPCGGGLFTGAGWPEVWLALAVVMACVESSCR